MGKQGQSQSHEADNRNRPKVEPASTARQVKAQPGQTQLLDGPGMAAVADALQEQAVRLNDPRLQTVQRQRLARRIGAAQGNQHLQKVVSWLRDGDEKFAPPLLATGNVIARRDGDPDEETASFELTHPRFTSSSSLRQIAAAKRVLSRRDNGRAVRAIQQALLDLGYSLLRYHMDGKYGGETTDAIKQFRTDQGIPGEEMDVVALAVLDRVAPTTGTAQEHYVDYERLLADDQIDFTLAIGFDEPHKTEEGETPGVHIEKAQIARDWLNSHGFTLESTSDDKIIERYSAQKEITYPTAAGERRTKMVTVRVNLITPGTGAAAHFGEGLDESEIAIYTGHARRGVGPDFDHKKSPAENFVMGVNSALHEAGRVKTPTDPEHTEAVRNPVNNLEEMTEKGEWDEEKYRVWFFNACTTLAYMDELRGGLLPEEMNRRNLDLFGTTQAVPSIVGIHTSLALIEGILKAETMEQISRSMSERSAEVLRAAGVAEPSIRRARDAYFREGAGDNPVAGSVE